MYPLAIVFTAIIALAIGLSQMLSAQVEATDRREVQALSGSASIYLGGLKSFVRANPGFTGTVPESSLNLPTWYAKLDGLSCYVVMGTGYLYLSGVPERMAAEVADSMDMQYAYGVNRSGFVTSPSGERFSVPSQIPEGSYVIRF